MLNKEFVMDLARLVIAAAWADGRLQNEEINSLKDLLFNLEEVTGEDWATLEIYMDSPVEPQEADQLLERVLSRIKSPQDRDFVIATLENLIRADGVVSDEEKAILEKIKEQASSVEVGIFAKLSKMMKRSISNRNQTYKSAAQRESQINDFIENKIYYQLKSDRDKKGIKIDLPEEKLKQLCLAAGLLARIAAVDSGISDREKQTIRDVLSEQWNLSERQANIITEISCDRTLKGLDFFRLTRGFFECTTLQQRKDFIKSLFRIANASDKTSHDETEEIRRISNSLKLSHKDFIEAKLTIPDEQREVL
ncbi:MAG: TerB family tellurite resistance protein [Sedimentisphaerales bacterium]|nr:TerB family tellurite resistance protein [Sedimentisphaerales bacterium]